MHGVEPRRAPLRRFCRTLVAACTVAAVGCGSLLGIDELPETKTDASAGSAGAAGSGGMGAAGGIGGAAGGGAGGADASAGSAGVAGVSGTGALDAGDSAVPSCDDLVANGTETDVDCGGPTCAPCLYGKLCAVSADCAGGTCDKNRCTIELPVAVWDQVGAMPSGDYEPMPSAYDPVSQLVWSFGGRLKVAGHSHNGLFSWNGIIYNSVDLTPPISTRLGHVFVHNPEHQKLIVFSGYVYPANTHLNETWTYDTILDTWAQKSLGSPPSVRLDAAGAWDGARKELVVFGGQTFGTSAHQDTYTWNGSAASWTLEAPPANKPAVRYGHRMVFDVERGRVVLFGGRNVPGLGYADTWEWNGTQWAFITDSGPSARAYHGLTYDSHRRRTVLVGGVAPPNNWLSETWEYDGTAWVQTVPNTAPPNPGPAVLVYDAGRARSVRFGMDGLIWEYYTLGTPCTADKQCGSAHCVDNVCCEAACGVCQACNTLSNPGSCISVTGSDPDSCLPPSSCDGLGTCVP